MRLPFALLLLQVGVRGEDSGSCPADVTTAVAQRDAKIAALEARLAESEARADFRTQLNEALSRDVHDNHDFPSACLRMKHLPQSSAEFDLVARQRGHPIIFEDAWELFGPKIPRWRNTSYLSDELGHMRISASYFDANDPSERFGITPVDGGRYILQPLRKSFTLKQLVAFDDPDRLAFAEQFNFIHHEEYEPWPLFMQREQSLDARPMARPVEHTEAEMAKDWEKPAFIGHVDPSEVNLWLGRVREGRRPKESPTHYDPHDNLMLQLRGTKTFHMYHAFDAAALYPQYMRIRARANPDDPSSVQQDAPDDPVEGPLDQVQDNFSPIDPTKPDFKAFPRSRRARPITCTLRPGEALYMPAFTWHNVVNRGEKAAAPLDDGLNIGVNVWWPGDWRFTALFESVMALLQGGRIHSLWHENGKVPASIVPPAKVGPAAGRRMGGGTQGRKDEREGQEEEDQRDPHDQD